MINPYRYREYRYDNELSWYFLNSRYYNPQVGRFINADGLLGQVGDILSTNMYAYCANNPVMYTDSDGFDAILITDFDKYGLKGFGHTVLLIQDEDGNWWISEFTGSSKKDASVYTRQMTDDDKDRFINGTGFWNTLGRLFHISGNNQVYLKGDYTASLELAIGFRDNQDFGKYNVLFHNCNSYVQTLLRAGSADSKLVQFSIMFSITPIPSTFVAATSFWKTVSETRPIFIDIAAGWRP